MQPGSYVVEIGPGLHAGLSDPRRPISIFGEVTTALIAPAGVFTSDGGGVSSAGWTPAITYRSRSSFLQQGNSQFNFGCRCRINRYERAVPARNVVVNQGIIEISKEREIKTTRLSFFIRWCIGYSWIRSGIHIHIFFDKPPEQEHLNCLLRFRNTVKKTYYRLWLSHRLTFN
jgi:hypothetical protein